MSKRIKIIVAIALLVLAVTGCMLSSDRLVRVKSFDVFQYSDYINDYSEYEYPEIYVGPVLDEKTLIVITDELWADKFGEAIEDEKPYVVYYDEINRAWHIKGSKSFSLRKNVFGLRRFGGVAHLIVQETDGKVLALWHEK